MTKSTGFLKFPYMTNRHKPIEYSITKDGCWHVFSHSAASSGYRDIVVHGKRIRMHRFVFEHFKHKIPEGMVVMHSCDNRSCINPDHLSCGTTRDNIVDMYNKGRGVDNSGENNGRSKLESADADFIKRMKGRYTANQLASFFGVIPKTIRNIFNGKTWRK